MELDKRPNKNGSTTWCIQYFANGKRVREAIGPSKRQAELVLAKRKTHLREGRYFNVRQDGKLTVDGLLDRFLREHISLHKKPRSYLRYVAAVKVLKAFFGSRLIKNISPEDVHAFILHRRDQQKAAATINGEVAVLSSMFTWANKLHCGNGFLVGRSIASATGLLRRQLTLD